ASQAERAGHTEDVRPTAIRAIYPVPRRCHQPQRESAAASEHRGEGVPLRLALCQMNATVGDIDGNVERIRAGQRAARDARADLVLFPELAVTGYPPEDLLLREDFLARTRAALEELAAGTHGPIAVVGFPERAEDVYNAAAV